MSEQWKPIDGWHGRYQVSSLGRIRNAQTGNIRKVNPDGSAVLNGIGNLKSVSVARLVYSHFVGEIPEGQIVLQKNHGQGFSVDNLVLSTPSERMARTRAAHPKKSLYDDAVLQRAIELRASGHTNAQIGQALNVPKLTVDSWFRNGGRIARLEE